MNKLPTETRVSILKALIEGCSLRSTSRLNGVSINTVTKLLENAGRTCAKAMDRMMRRVPCRNLQLDEIWAFVHTKDKNLPPELVGVPGIGSVWTWVAIDADTKLIPSYLVGLRDGDYARAFVKDLASRLKYRVQITTDGLKAYVQAMEDGFGSEVDYAVLHKIYGEARPDEARYSPAECCGIDKKPMMGSPIEGLVCTSHVERQNLTMRMGMRRFTRLTNGFSKKLANHEHAVALHFFHYNFIRRHMTLRMPPALKAGIVDHWWTMEELVELIDRDEAEQKRAVKQYQEKISN
ncbi:MAG TPA: IS1 family transposase [Fimbriiglobus sp.]|jgi:IS1 family transposase